MVNLKFYSQSSTLESDHKSLTKKKKDVDEFRSNDNENDNDKNERQSHGHGISRYSTRHFFLLFMDKLLIFYT